MKDKSEDRKKLGNWMTIKGKEITGIAINNKKDYNTKGQYYYEVFELR